MFVWKRVMGHVIFSIYMLVLLMLVVFISHFYLSCYCTYIQISLRHWGLIWYVSYNGSLNNVILCQKVRGITGVAEATPIFRDLFYIPYINHVTTYQDIWLSDQLSFWPSGLLTSICTSSHLDFWPSGHLAIWMSSHPDFWPSGHLTI